MTESARRQRNEDRLAECHPIARDRFSRIIEDLEADGFRPRIQDAFRSLADQAIALETGNSDVEWGMHNAMAPDGTPEALAIDLLDDNSPLKPSWLYTLRLYQHARRRQCRTGVLFRLKGAARAILRAALDAGVHDYHGLIGFDPCHVEIADLTYGMAKAGLRPTDGVDSPAA